MIKNTNALGGGVVDFLGGTVGKNLPASAGDMSSPGPGKSHMLQSN